jgi:very-short-patch-repair endonuclease
LFFELKDGTHHLERKELDDVRDNHLINRGWEVIRISHSEYQKKTKEQLIREKLGLQP